MSRTPRKASTAVLEVLPEADHWRWRYLDEEAGVELLSNEAFESPAEARRSAARAYPGVPFTRSSDPHDGATPDAGRVHFIVAAALFLVVVGLLLVIVRSDP